jgi:hypothetical protein
VFITANVIATTNNAILTKVRISFMPVPQQKTA